MRTRVAFAAMVFAGLTHRFLAALVDAMILFALNSVIAILDSGVRDTMGYASWVACFVLFLGVLPATRMQGSPGKRLAGIKITGMDGERIGLPRALLRLTLWLLTLGTLGLGFLLAGWMPKRQALHDIGARTLVVVRKATPAEIAAATAPRMWWFNLVLGAAFIALFILLIYWQVDLHHSRATRSKVEEMVFTTRGFKAEVEAAFAAGRPPSLTISGLPRHSKGVGVKPDGTIVYEVADALIPGGRINLKPTRTARGIEWKCIPENIERKHLLPPCRD